MKQSVMIGLTAVLLAACGQGTPNRESAAQPGTRDYRLQVQNAAIAVARSKNSKLDSGLHLLAGATGNLTAQAVGPAVRSAFPTGDQVLISAYGDDAQALLAQLQGLGLQRGSAFGHVVSGWLPRSNIRQLDGVPALRFARPSLATTSAAPVPSRPPQSTGKVRSQGVTAMRADKLTVYGDGVRVGALSDSFDRSFKPPTNRPLTTPAQDRGSHDLPFEPVRVLDETPASIYGGDEGRAMLQIVHDVAPNVQESFATALNGEASFANNILRLADDGCQVIVDDVGYFDSPMFQDGIIAQAVNQVAARGVIYLSAAGNQASNAYEAPFRNSGVVDSALGELHDFDPGPGVDTMQRFTLPAGNLLSLELQWDDAYASASRNGAGAQTDLDVYLADAQGALIPPNPQMGQFTVDAGENRNGDPVAKLQYLNRSSAPVDLNLIVARANGPAPRRIKWVNYGGGTVQDFATNSPTTYGQAGARGAIAVGAAYYAQTPAFGQTPPLLEGFSSRGGTPILRDVNGNPVEPEVRQKPQVTGPDGGNTTFFIRGLDPEGDGFPNFFGTSAAAPHVAGVAALLVDRANRSGQPLTPDAARQILQDTATDMNTPGFDFDSGYGLVQADQALGRIGGR